jgi:integrase
VRDKRRRVLFNAVEYAVELGLLTANPLPGFKWKPPRVAVAVDRRSVVNPVQARTLLAAVRETRRSGPRLVAFFALLYFAALRPEEAATVRKHNLSLPDEGWGRSTSTRPRRTPAASGRTTGGSATSGSSRTVLVGRAESCRRHRS